MTNAPAVDLPAVLRALLISDSTINGIVKDAVAALGTFTQVTVPCIIFSLTGGDTNMSLDGVEDEQYPTARLEVYGNSYDETKALYDLVIARLVSTQQFDAQGQQRVIAGHVVTSIQCSQPEDSDEPLLDGVTLPDFVFATNLQAWLSRVSS